MAAGASAGHTDCSLMSRPLFCSTCSPPFFLPFSPLAFGVDSWCSVARLLKFSYAPKGLGGSDLQEKVFVLPSSAATLALCCK